VSVRPNVAIEPMDLAKAERKDSPFRSNKTHDPLIKWGRKQMLPSQLISIPKMFQANIAVATLMASTRSVCARERMSTSFTSASFILRRLSLKSASPNRAKAGA
jgi:hypothetical protein